jgi:uncharacterized membrane protein
MSELMEPIARWCAALVEGAGIAVITLASLYALGMAILALMRSEGRHEALHQVRQRLGRGILLGLEFLVAADIVHTVAVELTFETVSVLAIIVLIRTFLSFTLEVELTGRWPWQQRS